jgi:hypothetical protein
MKVKVGVKEIAFLSIFFTALALYFDIHQEHHVLSFIINHVIALLIALLLSKTIYYFITNHK